MLLLHAIKLTQISISELGVWENNDMYTDDSDTHFSVFSHMEDPPNRFGQKRS